ncbi:hypothetical protein CRG98_026585 [Punica granatum]|uniref:Uncharacterized protein n=1 Tax=Punica granatum TaxID=22663 RepID=A0A2I0J9R5_PUNGR|nr:hypothetical protein CRG98_026585 [Punica granatum]
MGNGGRAGSRELAASATIEVWTSVAGKTTICSLGKLISSAKWSDRSCRIADEGQDIASPWASRKGPLLACSNKAIRRERVIWARNNSPSLKFEY